MTTHSPARSNPDVQAKFPELSADDMHFLACEVDHDMKNEPLALDRVRWNSRCVGSLVRKVSELESILAFVTAENERLKEQLAEIPEAIREEARVKVILKHAQKNVAPLAEKELAGEDITPEVWNMRPD